MRDFLDKYLPPVIWIIVASVASWGAWAIVTSREEIPATEPAQEAQQPQIPPAVVDQPILEEVTADGSVRWTLYLDRIVREEGARMDFSRPRALYRFRTGEILEVTGESGSYDEEGGVLNLEGGVRGIERNSALQFWVNTLRWDSSAGVLTASGNVTLKREGIVFRGRELRLDVSEGLAKIEVTGDVHITGTEAAGGEPGLDDQFLH